MNGPSGIDPAWLWLGAGAVLAIAELAIPGIFLVWIAAAAILTGLAALAFGPPFAFQLVLFALFCMASVLVGRFVYERTAQTSADPLLNDRSARLVGRTVTVVEAIRAGEGRVKVGDGIWSAKGPDAGEGARVVVTGSEGGRLVVAPAPLLPGRDLA